MPGVTLQESGVLLAALAIAAPLARWLGIGSVLGYLVAGVLLGPSTIGWVFSDYEAKEILDFAEFGIVLLLFVIGLELRPKRLWAMRNAVFGLGSAQVAATGFVLAIAALLFGLQWQTAIFVGLALALSSTAFALQVMEETGDLTARHGRLGFAVLLFQDLSAIPLIALAPLFAVNGLDHAPKMDLLAAVKGLGIIAAVIVGGHFLLDHFVRLVALARVKEAMTATALLTVVGFAILMQQAGVPASLLAESSYRHQLEADIQPFEGLLLGLFFTAIGMTIDLKLLVEEPGLILALVAGLVAIKAIVLYALGRWQGLERGPARRLGLALAQGGEFAFVLFTVGFTKGVLSWETSELLTIVVTLSMAATPIVLKVEELLSRRRKVEPAYDTPPDNDGHVIIAGFGRFGQIAGRILAAKGIPFIALDIDAEQVEFVKPFGSQAFYGDASRPEILDAANAHAARAFVLAIDDVEASMRTAELVRGRYPNLPIYARARNRAHAHRLLDLGGITYLQRATFLSALDVTKQLLTGLGMPEREAERMTRTFRMHDERRLTEDYKLASDTDRLRERALSDRKTLEKLFEEDAAEEARLRDAAEEGRV
jgi:glutathione-regulated potassium-efflux system protein KefB